MAARLDGRALAWNASHRIEPGQLLEIGPARQGVYGYLHLAGGIATEPVLGSRSAHLVAGIGGLVEPGALLPAGPGAGAGRAGRALEVADRFRGGTVRVIAGFQTPLFDADTQARFAATRFRRGARASRMGVALEFDGAGFTARGQLDILSEMIVPGDIQMTGDGRPFVLLTECQTTGGYPRIGAVIPADLALVAQAPPGAALRFAFVDRAAALEAEARHRAHLAALPGRVRPLLRDPADMPDLLAQQLVGGVVSALDDPFADPRSRPEPERSEP